MQYVNFLDETGRGNIAGEIIRRVVVTRPIIFPFSYYEEVETVDSFFLFFDFYLFVNLFLFFLSFLF